MSKTHTKKGGTGILYTFKKKVFVQLVDRQRKPVLDQLYHSIHMFDFFFIKNIWVDFLYHSIHMFGCLLKTLRNQK